MSRIRHATIDSSPVSRAVAGFLERATEKRYMVAVSGGPDSVALLLAVADQVRSRDMKVYACWVDHGIRPEEEIAAERSFVEGLCKDLGVELAIETAGHGTLQMEARKEGGIEAAARRFRYVALERARLFFACDVILTGHTADDCIETMVMRFCTGSGTAGLRGIPARNGVVARPLLSVSKAEVFKFLDDHRQAYRVDSTNLELDYLRNRVRKDIIPALLSVFPALGSSLGTLAGKLALDEDALASGARALLVDATRIDAALYDRAPLAIRIRALHLIATPLGSGRLSGSLVDVAARSEKLSGILASGAGIEFYRDGGFIRARARIKRDVRPDGIAASGYSLLVREPGSYRIGTGMVITIYSTGKAGMERGTALSWPVCIRSRRPGDSLALPTGHKMVDSLLSECRIPAVLRDTLPVVEDRMGIVALLSSCAGGRDFYRDTDNSSESGTVHDVSIEFFVFDVKGAVLTDAT